MAKGRPRKPTAKHILEGTFRDDRHGKNGEEPRPLDGVPMRPRHLSKHAKEMWDELVKVMGATGVLTKADRNVMAAYCEAYSSWREAKEAIESSGRVLLDSEGGRMYRNPYCAIAAEAVQQMSSLGAMLGLDPAARTRLQVKSAPAAKGIQSRDRSKGPPPPPTAGKIG